MPISRLVKVMAVCHHEAAVHQAHAVVRSRLAEQTLVLERTLPQVVWCITMGTPTSSEVRTPQDHRRGGEGVLLVANRVRREGRHARREWPISFATLGRGTPIGKACLVSLWRRPLGHGADPR